MNGWAATAAALALASAGAALAQAVPAAVAQSGAPTREEVNRADLTPTPEPSKLTVEGGIERAPCALADPRFADVKITLADAAFDNLREVSPALLRPAFADLVGKNVPIAAVCEIRDRAATILRKLGYLASASKAAWSTSTC